MSKPVQLPPFDEEKAADSRYLRKYFTALDGVLTPDKADPLEALERMTGHLEGALADTTEKGFGEYFRDSVLPLVVMTLMDRSYESVEHIDVVFAFVAKVIDAVVAGVRDGSASDAFLRSLEPLVTVGMDFYTTHGIEADPLVAPAERAKYYLATGTETQFSYIDSTEPADSVYYARMISELGHRGLFDAMLARLASPLADAPKLASSTLALFTRLIHALEDDLTPAFLNDYLPPFASALLAHTSSFTPDEAKTQNIEELAEALNTVAQLVKRSHDEAIAALNTDLQQAKVDLALFFIELPFLAPSLRGMDYLQHLMKVAEGKKAEDSSFKKAKKKTNPLVSYYPAAYASPAVAAAAAAVARAAGGASSSSAGAAAKAKAPEIEPPTLLTIPFLLNWMSEQNLMDRVLKAGHPEVVKHGSHILTFIAVHDDLANSVLDSMWASVLNGHESLQAKLFEVILALIPVLPLGQIDYLFNTHIATLTPDRFDNQVLTFVSDFTLAAVARVAADADAPPATYGLDIFWNILLSADSDSIVRETCSFLQRLLAEFPSHRETYVGKCVANLAAGTIVPTSIALLSSIFDSYTPNSLAEAITELDAAHALVDVLVAHLASLTPPPGDDLDAVLSLIERLLTASPLEMSSAQASALWDAAAALDSTPAVIDWFYSLSFVTTMTDPYTKEQSYGALSAPVKAELFTSRIAALDPATLGAPSMRLYAAYFRDVNAKAGRLHKISDVLTRTLAYDGLEGLDFVWTVAATNPDADVANEALFVLRDVYANAAPSLPASAVVAATAAATQRALDHLTFAPDEPVGPRMIWFLKELVVATARPGAPRALVPGSPAAALITHSFEKLFGLAQHPALMDGVWELVCLLPDEPLLGRAVFGLEVDAASGALAAAAPVHDADSAPVLYTLRVLYTVSLLRRALELPGWAEAFVARGGVEYLISVFTSPALLDPANPAAVYGKRAASLLAALINAVFNAPGLMSAAELSSSMNASFIHNLMSQVAELAAPQPPAQISRALVLSRPKPPAGSRGSLIANCHYGATPKTLRFDVDGPGAYQVAVYCIDYNTTRRVQSLVAYTGDNDENGVDEAHAVILSGPQFHNGQWVVWHVFSPGTFNIRISVVDTGGPNWTFSAFLIDPLPADAVAPDTPSPFPTLAAIDPHTQGRWRGVYGSAGGVLLGKTDYPVASSAPPLALASYDMAKASKYEWISKLTSDPRAMQQVGAEPIESGPAAADEPPAEAAPPPAPEPPATNAAASFAPESGECIVPDELLSPKSGSAAKSLLDMLFASIGSSADLTAALLEYPGGDAFAGWLKSTLMLSADAGVRAGVADGLVALVATSPAVASALTPLLLDQLAEAEALRGAEPAPELAHFFAVLGAALDASPPDALALFTQVVGAVKGAPIVEDDDGEYVDTLLAGQLGIVAKLVKASEEVRGAAAEADLATYLFDVMLFGAPETRDDEPLPKAKSPQARAPAFDALVTLVLALGGAEEMVAKVSEHLADAALPTGEEWNVDPENPTGTVAAADAIGSGSRSRRTKAEVAKYRGLKNQGCTCYMNASLQQMFLIRELRDAVLNVPLPQGASEEEQAKNIMFQLQLLFAHMQESKESWVDTLGFCKTVKMAGDFIRLGQQEDANEFLNGLVDQLEPHLAGTPQEHVFRDVFGGTFMNQIVSKECEHISERPEEYLTISVKVQGKRNLQEGLEFLIQGDMLDGDNKYHCEACDAKVAANKRCVIQHLPNTLALHLCRFEFSFETFQNVKVNDRFEFPETLNMKPYTREGLAEVEGLPLADGEVRPDSYYEYKLAGVIIHNGSANAGHYFSYIRERDGDAESAPWYEFNDRRVSGFAKDDLDAKAFGGAYSGMSTHAKSFSGYLLFYERAERFAARVYDSAPLPAPVPVARDPVILAKLWHDGVLRAGRRRLLGAPSLAFMWEVVKAAPVNLPTLQLMTSLIFDLFSHCAGVDNIAGRIEHLKAAIDGAPLDVAVPFTRWFLTKLASVLCDWLRNVLVKCPTKEVREAASDLVVGVMATVASHEATGAWSYDGEPPADYVPLVVEFGSRVVKVLRLAAYRSPKTTGPLVAVLKAYAELSDDTSASLVTISATKELVQLYMAWKTPVSSRNTPAKDVVPPQRNLVELIVALATSADARNSLPEADVDKVFEKTFLTAICGVPAYSDLATKLITFWVVDNELLTDRVLLAISAGLNIYFDAAPQRSFGHILSVLVGIEDELAPARYIKVAAGLVALLTKNLKISLGRTFILNLMIDLCTQSQAIADVLTVAQQLADLIARHGSLRNAIRDEAIYSRFIAVLPAYEEALKSSKEAEGDDDDADTTAAAGVDVEVLSDEDPDAVVAGPALPPQ